jgi:hypothetical protein
VVIRRSYGTGFLCRLRCHVDPLTRLGPRWRGLQRTTMGQSDSRLTLELCDTFAPPGTCFSFRFVSVPCKLYSRLGCRAATFRCAPITRLSIYGIYRPKGAVPSLPKRD